MCQICRSGQLNDRYAHRSLVPRQRLQSTQPRHVWKTENVAADEARGCDRARSGRKAILDLV